MQGSEQLRVALMRGDDHHNLYLDSLFRAQFNIVLTVIEPGAAQRRAIHRFGKKRDVIAVEYHRIRRSVLGLDRYRRRFFGSPSWNPSEATGTLIVADTINAPSVQEALRDAHADICVITCTTKLSIETIESADCQIVNIHGGHLPDYRGCHCFFFALYEGNYDKIGSTIHLVDAGLDTGALIEVARPSIRPRDNAEMLYCKAEKLAAERLAQILSQLEPGGRLSGSAQPYRGRLVLRRHRLPHHDIAYAIRRWTGLKLPVVGQGQIWDRNESS